MRLNDTSHNDIIKEYYAPILKVWFCSKTKAIKNGESSYGALITLKRDICNIGNKWKFSLIQGNREWDLLLILLPVAMSDSFVTNAA